MATFGITFGGNFDALDQAPFTIPHVATDAITIGPHYFVTGAGSDTTLNIVATSSGGWSIQKGSSGIFLQTTEGGYLFDLSTQSGVVNAMGGTYGDSIVGGSANDSLDGGAGGPDTLDGGLGNDTLVGGDGADTYKFSGPLSGDDTINGFAIGSDNIWLANSYGFTIDEIMAQVTYSGGNAIIDLGNGDSITLTGIASGLDTSDFAIPNVPPFADIANSSYAATEQTPLNLKGPAGNAVFLVSDSDSPLGEMTVTLSVSGGILNVTAGTSGAIVTNSGTSTVTITGTFSQINGLLRTAPGSTVEFIHNSDTPPAAVTLTLTINDNGHSGTDGPKTATDTATITIAAVNDAPTITAPPSVAVTEDQPVAVTGISFADVDAGGGSVFVALSVAAGQGTLSGTSGGGVTVISSGTNAISLMGTIAAINAFIAANGLTYTPAANANGDVTLGIAISDEGHTGLGSIHEVANGQTTLTIAPVNDAPGLTLTPVVTSLGENASTSAARKVTDIDIADVDGGTNVLSLSGADAGLFVIQNGDLYLKAGARLDFETNAVLDVTVSVDDAGVGATPDASASFSLAITDVAETLTGNGKHNKLTGGSSSEIISGKRGNDTIKGNGGDDTIIGGAGADRVSGGTGADVFAFRPGDLPKIGFIDQWLSPLNGKFDLITDFKPGTDVIDLSALDANSRKSGNQAFRFEGESVPEGDGELSRAGDLVYQLYGTKPSARHTIVLGDTNGDGNYDFKIVLKGHHHLEASDFIL